MYFFLITQSVILAQKDSTKSEFLSVSGNVYHGFLWKHKKQAAAIGSNVSDLQIVELLFEWQTKGKRGWHKKFNYPKWGVSTQFIHVNNPNYGHLGFSVVINNTIKLIRSKIYTLQMRTGVGLVYFNSIYDINTNKENKFITSPLSFAVNLGFENAFQVLPNFQILLTPSFVHYSNGATVMPNWGANIPCFAFGVRNYFNQNNTKPSNISVIDKMTKNKNYLHLGISYGFMQDANDNYEHYSTYKVDASYGRKIGAISKILLGIDMVHSNMYKKYSRSPFLIDRVSIWTGHEFMFNRLGVVFGLGYYLHKPPELTSKIYTRIGLRYSILKQLYIGGFLRTHTNIADTIEWTLGITL